MYNVKLREEDGQQIKMLRFPVRGEEIGSPSKNGKTHLRTVILKIMV